MHLTSSTQWCWGLFGPHLLGSGDSLCGCKTICLHIHLFMDFELFVALMNKPAVSALWTAVCNHLSWPFLDK